MSVGDIARTAGGIALITGAQVARTPQRVRSTGSHLALLSPPRRRVPWSPDFYDTPAGLEALAPGDLIRAEPMHAYLAPGVRLRARAWRILYRSTGAIGEPTAVSGTVLLPPGSRGKATVPLVAYAIGTHGIGDDAAPSRLLSTGRDWEAGLMALILARGYATVVTRLSGPRHGRRPRLHGRSCARLQCARRDPRGAPAGTRGAARERAGSDHGLLRRRHGSGLGGAAARARTRRSSSWPVSRPVRQQPTSSSPGRRSTAASSRSSSPMARSATPPPTPTSSSSPIWSGVARETVAALRRSNILQAAIRGPRFARVDRLTNPNVLELPNWRARLRENRLGTMAPSVPVLLHHARHDQIVAFEHSEQLLEDWRALGVEASLHITRGGFDHLSGAVAGGPVALDWLAKQFARQGRRGARGERCAAAARGLTAPRPGDGADSRCTRTRVDA